MAWLFQHHAKKLIFLGIAISTMFHFAFNTFLAATDNQLVSIVYTTILLVVMGFLISVLFDKIKQRGGRKTMTTLA
jgi:RsiW-degrading membrane proteinase PrsW (M82 family)